MKAARGRTDRWRHAGMLPLYGLVSASAAALSSQITLGAWPLLTVLACPLLHLVMRRD